MNDQTPYSFDKDSIPHSTEAEQQLLGAILVNNDIFNKVSDLVEPNIFYDPVHRRIFEAVSEKIAEGKTATPVTLKFQFEHDEGLKELGGPGYLVRLAGGSISSYAARDYASLLLEIHQARQLQAAAQGALQGISERIPATQIRAEMDKAIGKIIQTDKQTSISLTKSLHGALERLSEGFHSDAPMGMMTGIKDFDEMTGGLHAPDLIILGGRPSMGKTALCTSIALRCAQQNFQVGIVSAEMSDESLSHRIMSELSGVEYRKFRNPNRMTSQELEATVNAIGQGADLPIDIVPPHVRDINGIYNALRRIKGHRGRLDLVVVDYLQLIRGPGKNRLEQMTEVSIQLKAMAKALNVPLIALSQLSRGVEMRDDKRPMLSDLRETGQIEQDADVVMFCYRDHYYLTREKPPKNIEDRADWESALSACRDKMEIIVAKQRMGAIGTVHVGCDVRVNRFWDLDPGKPTQEEMF
jgi:replicative DNA helicase